MDRSQGKLSSCGGWSVYHEVIENVLHIILSPAPSTVPSLVGAQNSVDNYFQTLVGLLKEACGTHTRPQAGPCLEITFILRDLRAGILGKRLPSRVPLLLLPSVAFERTGTPHDFLLYPTSESLTDNGQERRPTVKLYFLFQPIERGDKYMASLL